MKHVLVKNANIFRATYVRGGYSCYKRFKARQDSNSRQVNVSALVEFNGPPIII